MYKHILLPTDGSELSERAISRGIQFAKSVGARVTGFHAAPRVLASPLGDWGGMQFRVRAEAIFKEHAEKYLAFIERVAKQAGVPCDCLYVWSDSPYEEIVEAARIGGCDLIFMASHGGHGTAARILGSEAVKVLSHSSIPVFVYRVGQPTEGSTERPDEAWLRGSSTVRMSPSG
jgi:nucleotide-binding universal stress UspA family protein